MNTKRCLLRWADKCTAIRGWFREEDTLDLESLERDSDDIRAPRGPMADACLCESGLSFLPDYRFFPRRPDFLGIERSVDHLCFNCVFLLNVIL